MSRITTTSAMRPLSHYDYLLSTSGSPYLPNMEGQLDDISAVAGQITSVDIVNTSFNISLEWMDSSDNLRQLFDIFDFGDFEKARQRHNQPAVLSLMVLYTLSFVSGLVGNSLVLFTVAKFPHMRTVTNAFLANLAVCDLLVVIVCMPISLGMEVYLHWIYGPVMCRLVPFIQGVSVSGSMLTLTAVSLNRYYAIRKPLKARSMFTKRIVSFFLAGIWFVSIAIMSPLLYTNDLEVVDINGIVINTLCREMHWASDQMQQIYGILVFLLTYFFPLLFTFAVYLRICQRLWNHDKKLRNEPVRKSRSHNTVIENQLKGRRKVVKMLLLLVALFALSWLPYFVTQIYLDFVFDSRVLDARPFVLWLALSNSTVNPVCYCFMSERFKNCFRMICCCLKFKSPRGRFSRGSSRYTGFSRSKSNSFFRSTRTESIRFSTIDAATMYNFHERRDIVKSNMNGNSLLFPSKNVGIASEMSLTDLMQRDVHSSTPLNCNQLSTQLNGNCLKYCDSPSTQNSPSDGSPILVKKNSISSDSDLSSTGSKNKHRMPNVVIEQVELEKTTVQGNVNWESSI